jgi:hypothetical protein
MEHGGPYGSSQRWPMFKCESERMFPHTSLTGSGLDQHCSMIVTSGHSRTIGTAPFFDSQTRAAARSSAERFALASGHPYPQPSGHRWLSPGTSIGALRSS